MKPVETGKRFAAGEAETLSMEVPTSPATPSLATPLCGQDLETSISGRSRRPLLINVSRANEERPRDEQRQAMPTLPVPVSQWMVTLAAQPFQTILEKVMVCVGSSFTMLRARFVAHDTARLGRLSRPFDFLRVPLQFRAALAGMPLEWIRVRDRDTLNGSRHRRTAAAGPCSCRRRL